MRDQVQRMMDASYSRVLRERDEALAEIERHRAEWSEARDLPRLVAQAQEISRLLSEARINAMPLVEGVRTLVGERDEWQASAAGYGTDAEQYKHERDELRALLRDCRPAVEWAREFCIDRMDSERRDTWEAVLARLDACLGGGRDE